jgi:hypothetical protein
MVAMAVKDYLGIQMKTGEYVGFFMHPDKILPGIIVGLGNYDSASIMGPDRNVYDIPAGHINVIGTGIEDGLPTFHFETEKAAFDAEPGKDYDGAIFMSLYKKLVGSAATEGARSV